MKDKSFKENKNMESSMNNELIYTYLLTAMALNCRSCPARSEPNE